MSSATRACHFTYSSKRSADLRSNESQHRGFTSKKATGTGTTTDWQTKRTMDTATTTTTITRKEHARITMDDKIERDNDNNGSNDYEEEKRQEQERNNNVIFDYIIVGAGPSAIGLLYGILSSYYEDEEDKSCNNNRKPMLSIAVIERGNRNYHIENDGGSGGDANNEEDISNSTSSSATTEITKLNKSTNSCIKLESRSKPSSSLSSLSNYDFNSNSNISSRSSCISNPSHWYKAAHDKHENVIHHPILLKGNRITDLPIGKGLGGTSLINAGLCCSPLLPWNNDNDDFQFWPEPWKTQLGTDWIPHIQNTLESNGHLYYYDSGIKESIPYHYEYYNCHQNATSSNNIDKYNNKDIVIESTNSSSSSSLLQINPKGTPNLVTRQQEDGTSSSYDYVRSAYYNALLEPFLIKHPSISKCITWHCGVQVERLLCDETKDTMMKMTMTTNDDTTSSKRVVTGVEVSTSSSDGSSDCCHQRQSNNNKVYTKFYARHDVILCSGAIESPALLLLDQLEMKRQCHYYRRKKKDVSKKQKNMTMTSSSLPPNESDSIEEQHNDNNPVIVSSLSGVGRHLRDQVLLPHAYLTPPSVWGMRSINKPMSSSPNGIAFLGYLRTTTTKGSNENDNEIIHDPPPKQHHPPKNELFQVAVADSAGQEFTIPALLTMALRRGRGRGHNNSSRVKRRLGVPYILEGMYILMKTLLYIALVYTPLGWFLRHCTTTTLLILLSPQSSGSLQIRPLTTDDTSQKVFGKHKKSETSSELIKRSGQEQEEPWRRHMVELDIDVGYLRDDTDIRSLKRGWDACTTLVRPRFLPLFPPFLPNVATDWWWNLFCCSFSLPYYHFMGTCAMKLPGRTELKEERRELDVSACHGEPGGSDNDDWVVDPSMRVREYSGLRICDASVVPTMISAPPALTLTALGYGLGRTIRPK